MQTISKEQLRILQNKVMGNCERMLGFLSKVLGSPEYPSHEIPTDYIYELYAIFTHAVEEYGKYVYLVKLEPNKKRNYNIESGKFMDHESKFDLALANLLDEVKVVFNAPFDSKVFSDDFGINDTLPTWQNRVNILNVDIDVNGDATDITFKVDMNELRKSIWEMQNNIPYGI